MNVPHSAAAVVNAHSWNVSTHAADPRVVRLAVLWASQVACLALGPGAAWTALAVGLGTCATAFQLVPALPSRRTARSAGWCLALACLLGGAALLGDGGMTRGLALLQGLAWRLGALLLLTQLCSAGRKAGTPWSPWLVAVVMVGEGTLAMLNVDATLLAQAGRLPLAIHGLEAALLLPWLARFARGQRA